MAASLTGRAWRPKIFEKTRPLTSPPVFSPTPLRQPPQIGGTRHQRLGELNDCRSVEPQLFFERRALAIKAVDGQVPITAPDREAAEQSASDTSIIGASLQS